MSKTATIRVRIEPGLKSEVEEILSKLGLTASDAVHLLYRQIKLQQGLPFDARVPNDLTARTLNASRAGRQVKGFGSKKELYADLQSLGEHKPAKESREFDQIFSGGRTGEPSSKSIGRIVARRKACCKAR